MALTLLFVALALIHSVWLVRLSVSSQVADPLVPFVIAVAFRRPALGPLVGVSAGLLQDLLFGGSLGLFALPKLVIGQGAAAVGRTVLVDQPLLPWVITAAATVLQQVMLAALLLVTGLLPWGIATLGVPLLVQIALNVGAALPVFALVSLALRRPVRRMRRRESHGI